MDPLSLAASVITLAETAFSVSKFLTKTWSSYRNAPEEVLEIAHEVNICSSLMTPFGERLETGSVKYSADFQTSVEWLVKNSDATFNGVRKLIHENGKLDKGIRPKWDLALKKAEIAKHRKRLKQVQQMFMRDER